MGVITIRKAVREGARLVIAFCGVSGSGKTVTAIHFAYGLANYDASKVGFLDTENRRGSLNADVLANATQPTNEPFLIADLHAPFSPDRYIQAIREWERAGIEVLVVDSASHEWEGTGGCTEIADANKGMWNKAKAEHKRFMNVLLQSDMHIVVCCRAREKDKPEKAMVDGREKTVYVPLGLQPIQEKNFLFEMTASLMMHDEGTRQTVIKCPGALRNILGRKEGYITADDGKQVRDWVDGALQLDPKVESYRNRLLSNAEGGVTHVEACWAKTPADIQSALGEEFHKTLIASAKGFDELKAEESGNGGGNDAAAVIAAQAERGRNATPPPAAQPAAQQPASPPAQKPAAAPATQGATRTPSAGQQAARTARPAASASHTAPREPASTRTPAPTAAPVAQKPATRKPLF